MKHENLVKPDQSFKIDKGQLDSDFIIGATNKRIKRNLFAVFIIGFPFYYVESGLLKVDF
ncbi:hypothetical protein CQA01_14320 [Cyclobacterium qasimii]|uniref:Uncharacterized protein n=1 Tax=Cyclobacterium qasimii TaxID=1350429 RepID=A0A512C9L8_9BACT|nr:hypothetical protein CQA01_14320 [Cyclobacterium qasimii]